MPMPQWLNLLMAGPTPIYPTEMNIYQSGIAWWCKFHCIVCVKWSVKYLARAILMHFTDEAPKHVHTHSGPPLLCVVFRNDPYISHFRIYPLLWSFFPTYWAVVAAIIIVQAKDLVRAFYSQVLRLSCSLTESKATAEDNLFTISEDCGRVTLTALFLAYFFCVCVFWLQSMSQTQMNHK